MLREKQEPAQRTNVRIPLVTRHTSMHSSTHARIRSHCESSHLLSWRHITWRMSRVVPLAQALSEAPESPVPDASATSRKSPMLMFEFVDFLPSWGFCTHLFISASCDNNRFTASRHQHIILLNHGISFAAARKHVVSSAIQCPCMHTLVSTSS